MISDLGILRTLDALPEADLRNVDALVDILLRNNHLNSRLQLCSRGVSRLANSFCWSRREVRDFLTGANDCLTSDKVKVRRIHATRDFCLMEWSFHKATRFVLPCSAGARFSFIVVQGRASVAKREGHPNSRSIPVEAGGLFQDEGGKELGCSFSAGTEALFFDFPPFRAAQRQSAEVQRLLPLPLRQPRDLKHVPATPPAPPAARARRLQQARCQILPARRVRSQRRSISDSM